jgi:hypothetical protein
MSETLRLRLDSPSGKIALGFSFPIHSTDPIGMAWICSGVAIPAYVKVALDTASVLTRQGLVSRGCAAFVNGAADDFRCRGPRHVQIKIRAGNHLDSSFESLGAISSTSSAISSTSSVCRNSLVRMLKSQRKRENVLAGKVIGNEIARRCHGDQNNNPTHHRRS